MKPLPKTLAHEPLVDAVFEVRMNDAPPLADILPGFLLHDFGKGTSVTRLPAAEIPQPMRQKDANLKFAPIQRVDLEKSSILIGDRNVVVNCRMPYPKWPTFKAVILDVLERIAKLGLSGSIERYSVKYVNLIQAATIAEQIAKIDLEIRLGDLKVTEEHVNLQVHRREDDIVHILSVITGATGLVNGREVSGVVVDIDSIRNVKVPDILTFVNDLENGLESLRHSNKKKFFSCLTDATIEEMGPTYE